MNLDQELLNRLRANDPTLTKLALESINPTVMDAIKLAHSLRHNTTIAKT